MNWRLEARLVSRALLAAIYAVGCAACGSQHEARTGTGGAEPRTVLLKVGETRQFTSRDLPAGSEITCLVGPNGHTYKIQNWSFLRPEPAYEWDNPPDDAEGALGVQVKKGDVLIATCVSRYRPPRRPKRPARQSAVVAAINL